MLAKTLDRMMDRLDNIERRPQWDNQQQIRNPDFRKNTNSGKVKETTPDQTIRPPFQENYAESSQNNDDDKDAINLIGIDDNNTIFLTRKDKELFELQQLKLDSSESFDYKQGYDYAINEIHSQYNLRNNKINKSSTKKTSQTQNNKTV